MSFNPAVNDWLNEQQTHLNEVAYSETVAEPPPPVAIDSQPKQCEMCCNYEVQLQLMQNKELSLVKKIEECEQTIRSRKEDLHREEAFRAELEEKFADEAKQMKKQIDNLITRFDDSNQELAEMRNLLSIYLSEASEKIRSLTHHRDQLERELKGIKKENEYLIGKHIAKSEQLQMEAIDLPQSLEDMQFYCLKLREDLIQALVTKERIDETINRKNFDNRFQ